MKALKNMNDIIVRPADKGGGIVILDKEAYTSEMRRILSDTETYLPLLYDPTAKYKRELEKLIDKGFSKDLINKKEKAFLVPMAPRIPVIYFLPKILKSLDNPPGRPIISGLDSVTSRIGKSY